MPPIYAGDAKEDIVVSGTASYGFESRPAYHLPEWWNRYTRRSQKPVMETSYGFKSRFGHHLLCASGETGRHAGLRIQFRKEVRVRVPPRALCACGEMADTPDVINGPLLGKRVRHPPARVARADQIGSSVASRCPPGRAGSIPARHNP